MDVTVGQDQVPELELVNLTADSSVVLITTDHISDEAAMRVALKTPVRYIGMIGSLSKCRTILGHLTADGFTAADLERSLRTDWTGPGRKQPAGDCRRVSWRKSLLADSGTESKTGWLKPDG